MVQVWQRNGIQIIHMYKNHSKVQAKDDFFFFLLFQILGKYVAINIFEPKIWIYTKRQ